MVVTDVKKEVQGVLRSEGLNQSDLGRACGMDRRDVSKYLLDDYFVSKTLVRMMEAIGYDIEISFVKRR